MQNNQTGARLLDTGPMCRTCLFEFLQTNFETHRIAPPAEASKPAKTAKAKRRRAEAKPS